MTNELTCLSRARKALAEARTVPELKAIRDDGHTAIEHAKRLRIGGIEATNDAYEIVLRAERRLGEELKILITVGGAPGSHDVLLKDLGMNKWQSRRYQAEASIPEDEFEQWMAGVREDGGQLTSNGLFSLGASKAREASQQPEGTDLRKKAISQVKESLSQLTKALDVLELCEDEWTETIKAIYRAVEGD